MFSNIAPRNIFSRALPAHISFTRGYQIFVKPERTVKVYQPLPKKKLKGTNLVGLIETSLRKKYDTDGWRSSLIKRGDENSLKPGDIVRVLKADKTHFSGMVISINRNGLSSSFLLRNKITGLGVETRYQIYSPAIKTIEIIRRPLKPKRQARIYYVRGSPKHDVGELETEIKQRRR